MPPDPARDAHRDFFSRLVTLQMYIILRHLDNLALKAGQTILYVTTTRKGPTQSEIKATPNLCTKHKLQTQTPSLASKGELVNTLLLLIALVYRAPIITMVNAVLPLWIRTKKV